MKSKKLLGRPGIAQGYYPQRDSNDPDLLQHAISQAERLGKKFLHRNNQELQKFVDQVHHYDPELNKISDDTLKVIIKKLRHDLVRDFKSEKNSAKAFAIIREVSKRSLSMPHYDVQLMGGWIMLNGMLAEMQTGEGKTLTATLPACTAALAGIPVHIVSVNDYLVTRDADLMRPLYEWLGLSVSTITEDMDANARRTAYQADITYCTGKQLTFDYLKDRLIINQKSTVHDQGLQKIQFERIYSDNPRSDSLLMRGLCFAIIDEADSVLIDEASTPIILSKQTKHGYKDVIYRQALQLAEQLAINHDFIVHSNTRQVELTTKGLQRLITLSESLPSLWQGKKRRAELVIQALTARSLFLRNQHYLVRDGVVEIIDEHTGRSMPDRKWEGGLHQMIELKEGCEISPENETLARITTQRFFGRYLKISGMTGTAKEVSSELWTNYGLGVVTVPTHKPNQRVIRPIRILNTASDKWQEVLSSVTRVHKTKQPILIATNTVAASDHISDLLHQKKLPHQVLNALQDDAEAQIITAAGKLAQITVATNMAGRGTDIKLAAGVNQLGGLHIIVCELSPSKRVERQIIGRCGRQGDTGNVELIYALDDELVQQYLDKSLFKGFYKIDSTLSIASKKLLLNLSQRKLERQQYSQRKALLKTEKHIGTLLAFSGSLE